MSEAYPLPPVFQERIRASWEQKRTTILPRWPSPMCAGCGSIPASRWPILPP